MSSISKLYMLVFVALILSACSTTPPIRQQAAGSYETSFQSCLDFYADIAAKIKLSNIQDAQSLAIRGYPYLHSNRFYASYGPFITAETKNFWVDQLQKLGLESQLLTTNNLPNKAKQQLLLDWQQINTTSESLSDLVKYCAARMHTLNLYDDQTLEFLVQHSKIPDNYATWKRVAGIYPVVSVFMAMGISRWHKNSTAALTQLPAEIPIKGVLYRYLGDESNNKLTDPNAVESILKSAMANPLKIPLPSQPELASLFATFAPIWEIDTESENDKVGAVYWPKADGLPEIDLSQPTVYQLASHVHFYGKTLLQLNYFIWMPQRPCTSGFDFLCGRFDGFIWRVTLKENGQPLLYDSIHNCGCYHTFFPVDDLKPTPLRLNYDETAFVPIKAPKFRFDQSLTVRLSSVSHYLNSVYYSKAAVAKINPDETTGIKPIVYKTKPYNTLRSIVVNDKQNKSLFKSNGIVAGTERKERWVFWPMGITSPGAMRQWGTHATAFVGRRHFDDPCLLENSFLPLDQPSESIPDNITGSDSANNSTTQFNYLCAKDELENNQD